MAKLHEILAVEGELEGAYKKILAETAKVFADRPDLFMGYEKVYNSFLDEAEHDILPAEHHEMTTTVPAKLQYMFLAVVRYFDAVLQKDSANQAAVANIEIDGVVLAENVPATTLLGLETKLKLVRAALTVIPTLQMGMKWEKAADLGVDIYRQANPEETMRTRKKMKYVTVAEPTDRHPAQVEKEMEEERIGKSTKTNWSGMLTPARKSEILGNLDKVARAVKQARQRANCVEVKNADIGAKLVDAIMG